MPQHRPCVPTLWFVGYLLQVLLEPLTHWEVGFPRGQGHHEPQRYAQQQHRMQPYPMNQQGGYSDAMLGHGPGASSGDSGARLSPGGGLLTRAWRALRW